MALFFVADHQAHAGQVAQGIRVDLGIAARDNDPAFGVVPSRTANQVARLGIGGTGYGAGIDNHQIGAIGKTASRLEMKLAMAASVLALALAYNVAAADVPAEQEPEVDHLLNYVRTSPCQFQRNGEIHDGIAAESHIRNKYDFFRSKIETTEQFIEWSATKSTISGRYYRVKCTEAEWMETRDWLLKELENFRRGGDARAAPMTRSRIC